VQIAVSIEVGQPNSTIDIKNSFEVEVDIIEEWHSKRDFIEIGEEVGSKIGCFIEIVLIMANFVGLMRNRPIHQLGLLWEYSSMHTVAVAHSVKLVIRQPIGLVIAIAIELEVVEWVAKSRDSYRISSRFAIVDWKLVVQIQTAEEAIIIKQGVANWVE
jgi:hypothetical protein